MPQIDTKIDEIIYKKLYFEPIRRKIRLEKRKVRQDRRRMNTYLADDRRSGIADRRKRR